jgi:hypothetical protein
VQEPILWVKQTIGSFRWLDLSETYHDLGWEPEPLLVVRDARAAYRSVMGKWYVINGTTAEDLPYRMRFRRFLRDWELFRSRGWPIIKFEDFIQEHRPVLMKACEELSLPWDDSMVSWPKNRDEIAYAGSEQETFSESIEKGSMSAAKLRDRTKIKVDGLPRSELEWLEETFSDYNAFHNYPEKISPAWPEKDEPTSMPAPSYKGTAREWYYGENERMKNEYWRLIEENEKLRGFIDEFFAQKRNAR